MNFTLTFDRAQNWESICNVSILFETRQDAEKAREFISKRDSSCTGFLIRPHEAKVPVSYETWVKRFKK